VSTDFTSPAFIERLRAKAHSYYFGADTFNAASDKRFPKEITEDPLFKAIYYLRRRFRAEQRTQEAPTEHRDELLGAEDPRAAGLLSESFVEAVRRGDIGRFTYIVKLCEIIEAKTFQQPKARQSDPLSWHYYAGIVACGLLGSGTIPTKKQVKEAALKERAIVEVPKWDPAWNSNWSNRQKKLGKPKPASVKDLRAARIAAKIEELRRLQPKNWPRVFRDLGLGDLPSAPTHGEG
jgi:hypothetical protein